MKLALILISIFSAGFSQISFAKQQIDLGFRFKDGKCLNEAGEEGLNPKYLGQCSGLKNAVIEGIDLDGIDFRGSDLENAKIGNLNLSGADLSFTNLKGASLSKVTLVGVNLTNSNLESIQFIESDLSTLDFTGLTLSGAKFLSAELKEVSFQDSELEKANFTDSNLEGAIFINAKMKASVLVNIIGTLADFENSDLTDANLSGATLDEANFTKANLKGANLSSITGGNQLFTDANLENCNLSNAILSFAEFRTTKVTQANFSSAKLEQADFSNASGVKSVFARADLGSANFSDTELMEASFDQANMTDVNLSKSTIKSSSFQNAVLRRSNFTSSILDDSRFRKSRMENSRLEGASFLRAQLQSTVMEGATIKDTVFTEAVYNRHTVFPFPADEIDERGLLLQKFEGIGLFYNGDYVDAGGGTGSEASNLKDLLESRDEFSLFMSLNADGLTTDLEGKEFILFPEFENGEPPIGDAGVAVLKQLASEGRTIIFFGQARNIALLGKIAPGVTLRGQNGPFALNTTDTEGTRFAEGPEALTAANQSDNCIDKSSLPEGSRTLYSNGEGVAAAEIPVGAGRIYYLSYDWFNAGPKGDQGKEDWIPLLELMLQEI